MGPLRRSAARRRHPDKRRPRPRPRHERRRGRRHRCGRGYQRARATDAAPLADLQRLPSLAPQPPASPQPRERSRQPQHAAAASGGRVVGQSPGLVAYIQQQERKNRRAARLVLSGANGGDGGARGCDASSARKGRRARLPRGANAARPSSAASSAASVPLVVPPSQLAMSLLDAAWEQGAQGATPTAKDGDAIAAAPSSTRCAKADAAGLTGSPAAAWTEVPRSRAVSPPRAPFDFAADRPVSPGSPPGGNARDGSGERPLTASPRPRGSSPALRSPQGPQGSGLADDDGGGRGGGAAIDAAEAEACGSS